MTHVEVELIKFCPNFAQICPKSLDLYKSIYGSCFLLGFEKISNGRNTDYLNVKSNIL